MEIKDTKPINYYLIEAKSQLDNCEKSQNYGNSMRHIQIGILCALIHIGEMLWETKEHELLHGRAKSIRILK